jgi:hypothetical protein
MQINWNQVRELLIFVKDMVFLESIFTRNVGLGNKRREKVIKGKEKTNFLPRCSINN